MDPVVPSLATLRKYGLTAEEWLAILERQGGVCPCGRFPGKGVFRTDHEHVKGWKTMAPEDRKKYVRGLTCWTCNFFTLAKGVTADRLRKLADYLDDYQDRRDGGLQ